jgi:hypothetical protein
MGEKDAELAGFFGSGPLVTRHFRHQSRSIGFKHMVLSVVLTVKLSEALKNFSDREGLRCCGTIEWQ